jgi:hypothetical protein
MNMPTTSRQAGISMLETLIVLAFGVMSLLVITSLTKTTNALASQSRAHLSAEGSLRRDLQQVCNVLRGVSLDTVAGFDYVTGAASEIQFERVIGLTDGEPIYSGAESLEWRVATETVKGVAQPGAVWLVSPAGDRIVASDVPHGGFLLRLDGDTILVSLRVYHELGGGKILEVTGETSVTARNDA